MNENEIRYLFNEGVKYNVFVIGAAYIRMSAHTIKESKMMTRTVNQAVIGHKISEQEFIRVKDRFGEPELKSKEMYYISNQEYKSSNYSRSETDDKIKQRLCFIGYQ